MAEDEQAAGEGSRDTVGEGGPASQATLKSLHFYSKSTREPLKGFKQRNDLT